MNMFTYFQTGFLSVMFYLLHEKSIPTKDVKEAVFDP